MRALKVLTVVMGVLIVAATGLLAVLIAGRLGGAAPAGRLVLHEPAGTRIVGLAATPLGLAVALSGGGPERIVVLDGGLRERARVTVAP